MKRRLSHSDMSGQAMALEVYARKGDLQGVRRTARSMRNLCRELELENRNPDPGQGSAGTQGQKAPGHQ